MKQFIIVASLLGTMLFGSQSADAQSRTNQRINQGYRSGQLTRGEYYQLQRQQAHLQRLKRVAMADGYVSHRERKMINDAQRQLDNTIYRQKHDRDTRYDRSYSYRNAPRRF